MFKKYFFGLSLKIGIVGALGHILYFFVFYFMETPPCDKVFVFDFWIPTIFIFLTIKFYRDKLNAGELRFWQGLSLGVQVLFWTSFLAAFVLLIYLTWFDASFFTDCMDSFRQYNLSIKEQVIKAHGKEAYDVATKEIEKITQFSLVVKKFLISFFVNIISILLFSVLFRR